MPVRPVLGAVKALGEGVGLGHQLAGRSGLGEDLGQLRRRGERLALFDAELAEHGQVEPVTFIHDLGLVDVVQTLPVAQAARLVTGPGPPVGGNQPGSAVEPRADQTGRS